MSFTQNYNRNVFGPIQWKLMGPIADRPATAEENTTYVSTDEGDGLLRAYIYTGGSWMKMQGIDGFTGGGGGGSSLPADPASDGTYVLENTVSSGAGTLSWGSGGGGSGILIVHDTDGTLDKTYAEIKAAGVAVIDAGAKEEWNGAYRYYWVVEYAEYTEDNSTEYVINATGVDYSLAGKPGFISYLAENEDGYPMLI